MITHEPNIFINDQGTVFTLPFSVFYEGHWKAQIVEYKNKIVMKFSVPEEHEVFFKNVICFDRHTSEVLWQIEPAFEWEVTQPHFFAEDGVGYFDLLRGFVKHNKGTLWIEELYYKHRPYNFSEEDGHFERHPDYQNRNLYKMIDPQSFLVRQDNHELEPRVFFEDSFFNHGYCGLQFYTDMTEFEEGDCLLMAESNVYLYEVDIQTGKITPAYVRIEQTK
jgi:hypothetical protein